MQAVAETRKARPVSAAAPSIFLPASGDHDPHRIQVGSATGSAPGKLNEDFHGIQDGGPAGAASHGVVAALGDGIGGDGSGRRAAEVCVRAVLDDYHGTSPAWPVARALDRLLCAANDWLHAQNDRRREADGLLATLSVLVLRGARYHVAHVGDTRVYRLRGGTLSQLTTDHVWPRHDMRHVPKRALGLDGHLVVDYADGELQHGDVFLLLSDGVWEVLGESRLRELLSGDEEPQRVAEALVADALERQARYMGRNDATAVVVRVAAVP